MQNNHAVGAAQVSSSDIPTFSVENNDAFFDLTVLRESTDPRTYGLEPAAEQPNDWHGPPVVEGPRPEGDWVPIVAPKRYKTTRSVRLAAWHCRHPEIDGIDKSLLAYLAEHSSGTSGGNAFPGNTNITDALRLTDSPTDARIAKLIRLGLIERTFAAIGRKKASVYRLRLESPYFPEQTPGREPLVEPEPASVRFMRALYWLPPGDHQEIVRWLASDRDASEKRNDLQRGENLPSCMSLAIREALIEMANGWLQ